MSSPYRLLTLTAGLSSPSSTRMLADRLGRETVAAVEAAGGEIEVETVELREYARDITDALLTRFPNERLARVVDLMRGADGIIAVTPVFNLGPSGLFKMFVDAVDMDVWEGTPLLLGATAGSARHSLVIDYALRPMFSYLKAQVVPTAVFAASADFGAADGEIAEELPLTTRGRLAAADLAGRLREGADRTTDMSSAAGDPGASPAGRDAGRTPSAAGAEFLDFVPMESLLGRD